MDLMHVRFSPIAQVIVEVARTPEEQATGLMGRLLLGDNQGMLFAFHQTKDQALWMENTFIPLDMIFMNENGVVLGIVENATPRSRAIRSIGRPSRLVLEVAGGWCARHGVRVGDRMAVVQ